MRQQQNQQQPANPTLATQLRRQADQGTPETRAAIVEQAQALDSQGQPSQFYYNSTVQQATAVTKAIKARFTWFVQAPVQMMPAPPQQNAQPGGAAEEHKTSQEQQRVTWRLETNLITFASNVLKVYALPSEENPHMDLRLSTQFNGRILDIITVPTEPFLREERASAAEMAGRGTTNKGRASARDMRVGKRKQSQQRVMIDTTEEALGNAEVDEEEPAPDYLFIILANFTVALVCYNRRENKLEVVSRGNISEKVLHDQKDPPYPIFLGQTGKFITLMLYHNILKVIPLVSRDDPSGPYICSLTHATAVRVCHSNVMQVVPLYQEGTAEQPTFGVVYQRIDHVRIPGVIGPPSLQIKVELEKQLFDMDRRDLTPHDKNGGKLEFTSNSVYRIEPLPFGGFLAFDIDSVAYYRGEQLSNSGAYHEQLKSSHSISAFCQVDEFDVGRGLTASGSPFVRFMFATDAGELFMLAMQVDTLNAVLHGDGLDQNDSLITIEFLAQKLTFCSSLVYLDDSLVFYSSKEGDSYILRICAEHQGNQDQPYVTIEQRFTSLAPIMDLQLARPENTQGQQAELVIVGGWNHQTNMNLVKQGVGLRSIKSFESLLPADMVQDFHVLTGGDRIFMRIYGYDQLIGVRVTQKANPAGKGAIVAVDGFDVSRNFSIRPNEQILALEQVKLHIASSEPKQEAPENVAEDDHQGVETKVENGEGQGEEMVVDQQQQQPAEEAKKEDINQTIEVLIYATDSGVKVLSSSSTGEDQTGTKLFSQLEPSEGTKLTVVKVSDAKIILAEQGGTIKEYRLQAKVEQDGTFSVSLTEVAKVEMGAEISAMTLSEDSGIVDVLYVTLYDAPHYSLNILSLSSSKAETQQSLRLLARLPLASILEMRQTGQFYQHQLVRNGEVFLQFNHGKTGTRSEILQDLPGENQPVVTEDKMQVDQEQPKLPSSNIAFHFNCSAARSIEHLTTRSQSTDTLIIGFANGKLLQMCVDLVHVRDINMDECAPFTDFQAFVEHRMNVEKGHAEDGADNDGVHEDLNLEHSGPFWGAQVSYVATVLPKLRKIRTDTHSEAVIACSDRPVVFYEANETIEMHYLAYRQIRDIGCVVVESSEEDDTLSRALLLYEDERGVLHLSENDSLRRLQVQRMVFKMQISKTLLVPSNDAIIVLLEQPNMDYIDASKQVCNCIALVSRSTMRTQAVFRLQKREIANCAYAIGDLNKKQQSRERKWLLVGTAFLNPEETIPSMGRILMLDAKTMELVQEFSTNGSVQSILVTDQNKFLLLAVNNQIQAYDFHTFLPKSSTTNIKSAVAKIGGKGKFEMLCQKSSGTFIQSIVKLATPGVSRNNTGNLAESIVVGDMTGRGVATFELKECRLSHIKIVESASSHISLWVNSIVALSDSQFIVFDHEGNLFIFQKNLFPTCIEEKLKLTLKASFHVGEQVQAAAFGSLRSTQLNGDSSLIEDVGLDSEMAAQGSKVRQKKRSYVTTKIPNTTAVDAEMTTQQAEEEKKEGEQVMIVTRGSVAKQNQKSQETDWAVELADPANFSKILRDIEYARRFAARTLEEMLFVIGQQQQQQRCSLVYGTADGSIGALFQIPPKVYLLLQLLQHEMDQHTYVDLVQQKRSEYRTVKQTAVTSTELQSAKNMLNGIIDGDLIEVYLDLPKQKKLEYARNMLGLGGRSVDEEFSELLVQIVSLMKKTH